jgi:hypothetical protein
MALNAATVWEVRTTGSDTNGGGFRAGAAGVDYSQQDSPQANWTGDVTATTTIVNVTGHTVSADDVGNHVQINTGTATAGVYEITAADVGNNRWTLDRAAGAEAATITAATMGGAFATPGKAGSVKVAGNTVWIKSGTYDLSSSNNVAGGRLTDSGTALSTAPSVWEGYGAARGDGGTPPLLRCGANSVTAFTVTGAHVIVRNLRFGNAGAFTGCAGVNLSGSHGRVINCLAESIATGFSSATSANKVRGSGATSCTTGFSGTGEFAGCKASGGTTGFSATTTGQVACRHCVASGCSGSGFSVAGNGITVAQSTAYGCGANGFLVGAFVGSVFDSCLAVGNAGRGFAGGDESALLVSCAGFDNGDGDHNFPASAAADFVTLTADPFTDAAGGDFTLNSTAGGGAELKGAGWPSALPGLSGTSHLDIGAYQSQVGGGSGGSGSGGVARSYHGSLVT